MGCKKGGLARNKSLQVTFVAAPRFAFGKAVAASHAPELVRYVVSELSSTRGFGGYG